MDSVLDGGLGGPGTRSLIGAACMLNCGLLIHPSGSDASAREVCERCEAQLGVALLGEDVLQIKPTNLCNLLHRSLGSVHEMQC